MVEFPEEEKEKERDAKNYNSRKLPKSFENAVEIAYHMLENTGS